MAISTIRICFVCLGNICRSPTAEGVMKKLALHAGVSQSLFIDSAGTGAYHVGEPADPRSRAEAQKHGVDLTSLARQFHPVDYDAFDYVIAMDTKNLRDLRRLARGPLDLAKLHPLRSFEPGAGDDLDVPDPYAGDGDGFVRVFDICQAGCAGLLTHLRHAHGF